MSEQGVPAPEHCVSKVFRMGLDGAQVLTWLSLFGVSLLFTASLFSGLADPCLGHNPTGLSTALLYAPFLVPDIVFLWLIHRISLRAGLLLAMAWGWASVGLDFLSGGKMLVLSSGTGVVDPLGGPYCAVHLAIAGCAGLAYSKRPGEALWPKKSHRQVLAGGVAFLVLIGLMLGLGWNDRRNWPGRGAARLSQATAVGSLQTINSAAASYSAAFEQKGFPESLAVLGPPKDTALSANAADLIDGDLAAGVKNGYRFRYEVVERDSAGRVTRYRVSARPVKYPECGNRNLMTDESGMIRFTWEDRECTVQDSPLQ